MQETHSAINKLKRNLRPVNLTENAQKGSLVDYQEDVSYTALTIVCTNNVSIDCDWFQVPNPSTRKKYTQKNEVNEMLGLWLVS